MGVPGLWPLLHAAGTDHALPSLALSDVVNDDDATPGPSSSSQVASSKPLRLGIDVSLWLFHSRSAQGGYNAALRLLFFRLARLAALPHLQPVFVFDGPLRPFEKRGRSFSGSQAPGGGYARHPLQSDLLRIIKAFGFTSVVAPAEAEAELAEMNLSGDIDAVMTDDGDSFVFGARTVIRNWGSTLGGSQARARRNREADDDPAPTQPADSTQPAATSTSAAQYGENLVALYRASSWERGGKGRQVEELKGLSREGFILIALMAGGDYDVKGLCKCGVKIAIGLALCGFGESLVKGFKEHCTAPPVPAAPGGHLPPPTSSASWSRFLEDWLDEVRAELRTNSQGHMTTRHAKLAASKDLSEFLGTKASLAVLASLVWPVTRGRMREARGGSAERESPSRAVAGSIDLPDLAGLCQRLFQWPEDAVLSKFRNNLWTGHVARQIVQGRSDDEDEVPAFFRAIHGRRAHPSTGGLEEVRVELDVKPLVEQARTGIDPNLVTALELAEGEEDWVAYAAAATGTQGATGGSTSADSDSADAPPSSPSKKRKEQDPEAPLRVWLPVWALSRHPHTSKLMHDYDGAQAKKKGDKEAIEARRSEKRAQKERKEAEEARQRGIQNFFAPAPPGISTVGGLGKRAPQRRSRTLPGVSLGEASKAPEKRAPSSPTKRAHTSGKPTSLEALFASQAARKAVEKPATKAKVLNALLAPRSSFARRALDESDSDGDVMCLDTPPKRKGMPASSDSDVRMASPHGATPGMSRASRISEESRALIAHAEKAAERLMAAPLSEDESDLADCAMARRRGVLDSSDSEDDDDGDVTLPSPGRFLRRALQNRTRSAPVGAVSLQPSSSPPPMEVSRARSDSLREPATGGRVPASEAEPIISLLSTSSSDFEILPSSSPAAAQSEPAPRAFRRTDSASSTSSSTGQGHGHARGKAGSKAVSSLASKAAKAKQSLITDRFIVVPKRGIAVGARGDKVASSGGAKTGSTASGKAGRKSQPIVIDDDD